MLSIGSSAQTLSLLAGVLLLVSCARNVVDAEGRGSADRETGTVATIAGEEKRHGIWRGTDPNGRVLYQLEYVRGIAVGPYREWDTNGVLRAEWSTDWDGKLQGVGYWYDENGDRLNMVDLDTLETSPDFDPVGASTRLLTWLEAME